MLTQQFLKADQDQSTNDKIGCDNECGLLYAPFRVWGVKETGESKVRSTTMEQKSVKHKGEYRAKKRKQ